MFAADNALLAPVLYTCPGERHPITRAVHLSRLAAFYQGCRTCPHLGDREGLSLPTQELLDETATRVAPESLFRAEGVRGVYLNQLDRAEAGRIAAAFASWLWEAAPLQGLAEGRAAETRRRPVGPTVLVGRDERPASPDLLAGVARALRRMGCTVIDAGLTPRPVFWHALARHAGAAGIHAAGSGCDPAWCGLDFLAPGGIPLSHDGGLAEIELRRHDGVERSSRAAAPGPRTDAAVANYAAWLRTEFHALRPLRIACGCPQPLLRDLLREALADVACRLEWVSIPTRQRNLDDPRDVDCARISRAVVQHQAHLGVLIGDDGQGCTFFDEQGRWLPTDATLAILAHDLRRERPDGRIVSGPAVRSLERMARAMQADAALVGGSAGRYWFREPHPACDALLTLARVLQALSRSDADVSTVAARAVDAQESAD